MTIRRAVWLALGLACAIAMGTALKRPRITIATGPKGTLIYDHAYAYRDALERAGFAADVISTENYVSISQSVNDPAHIADIGFTVGPVEVNRYPNVESLGTILRAPFWIFYRRALGSLSRVEQLRGMRVAIGPNGSPTQAAALRVLGMYGVNDATATLVRATFVESSNALKEGAIDVSIIMVAAESEVIQQLGARDDLLQLGLDQADAIAHRLDFVEPILIPKGSWSLLENRPPVDVTTIAGNGVTIARKGLNKYVVYTLLEVMKAMHGGRGLAHKQGEFPSIRGTQLPISKASEEFARNGVPFMYRELPYFLAVLLDSKWIDLVSIFVVVVSIINSIRALDWGYSTLLPLNFYEPRLRRFAAKTARKEVLAPHELSYVRRIESAIHALRTDSLKRCEVLVAEILRARDGG